MNPASIFASLDTHYPLDISHPAWWKDSNGNNVDPFTLILADDIKNGKYVPVKDPKRSLEYVENLENNGEFNHFIWPLHCIIGSEGHSLHPTMLAAFNDWMSRNLRWTNYIEKGKNPYTEHFGIFRANVPLSDDPNTQVNQRIFQALAQHDEVFLAGQAKSHCVVNSLKQILEIAPNLASNLIVLDDCMSNVGGLPDQFYDMVDGIYADAKSKGVRFQKSTDF
jgi:nicotinamidase-related amidase